MALSLTDYVELKLQGDWKRLWNLVILLKVKHLLWRAGCDCLPTRCRLRAKGLEVSGNCVLGTSAIENLFHIFVLFLVLNCVGRRSN